MEMCKGTFEKTEDPSQLVVPRPDLICVGSRGQKFLKRIVLGSVSSAVLSNACAPTCIYRWNLPPPSDEELAAQSKLGPDQAVQRVICVSLSGSDASHSVAEWLCQSLLRPSDKVVVLHCINAKRVLRRGISQEHVDANLKACEQMLKAWMEAHPNDGPHEGTVMPITLPEGPGVAADVRDRLVDFLDKTDVDLLVLGRSNRPGGFKTWALGTVPMYVVQHGNCPVLVVNAPDGVPPHGDSEVKSAAADVATPASPTA